MTEKIVNLLFGEFSIKGKWDCELGEYYFPLLKSISDIANTENPQEYLENLKKGALENGVEFYLNSRYVKDGIEVVNSADIFRIAQFIPSPKSEPIKAWLANVGHVKIREEINPDLIIHGAISNYKNQGHSDEWIMQKIESIRLKNALTD